jgi:CMP-N-acetylneuraminic acid synthetase
MSSYTAVIPVRDFDEYIHNKNVLPFLDSNLLLHKIRTLLRVGKISSIIVYTESETLKEVALSEHGVKVLDRPKLLATKNTVFNDLIVDISSRIKDTNIILTNVTCPLVTPEDYTNAISSYEESLINGFDSLVTVNRVKRYILDDNGPLNFRKEIDSRTLLKLPVFYNLIGAFSIAKSSSMKEWKYNWGTLPFMYELARLRSVDICTEDDYKIACALATLKL